MSDNSFEFILPAAREIVLRSGNIIREHRNNPRNIQYKGRLDLLTDTDLAVEDFLKRYLALLLPETTFLGEEQSPTEAKGKSTWIVDPLDGTTNFAHDLPFVSTSVALWQDGRVQLGIVNLPLLGECYWAVRGGGAFCNGRPVKVSKVDKLEHCLVVTGFPYDVDKHVEETAARISSVLKTCQGLRRTGSAALDLAYVAAGRMDAFYEVGLKPWDVAAGMLIVEEAGGRVSRFDGTAYELDDYDILASNGILHDAMVKVLAL